MKTPLPKSLEPALTRAAHGMARAKRILEHYRAHPPVCPTCGRAALIADDRGATVVVKCAGGHDWTMNSEDVVG